MRTEDEIREAHGYLKQAFDQAFADREYDEAAKLRWMCDVLVWVLGYGVALAQVVEVARKTKDNIELSAEILTDK